MKPEDFFKVPTLSPEDIERDALFNEVVVILAGLAKEGKPYTGDALLEILEHGAASPQI